jgi:polyhydroxyalkanoate synthase
MAREETPPDERGIGDPEVFARNLARFVEEAGKAVSAYLKPREEGKISTDYTETFTEVIKATSAVAQYWLAEPERTLEAQSKLLIGYVGLWNASLKRMRGEAPPPVAEPDPRDRRFNDPEWSKNQVFDFIKQFYLVTGRWLEEMVERAGDLDPHTRQKAAFYVKQIINALAPSNFVLTNPEILRETISSNGENLVRGMHMLADDIREGGGEIKLRQTARAQFKVGENLALTRGKVIHENELCQVIQYSATTKDVLKRPLLIVPPWINKFYILDLTPEKSFIHWCVDQGHTVFVISWVNPDQHQAKKSFEHYMREGILETLDVIRRAAGTDEVNAIGYCVGGTLLAVTLAYMAATGDDRIKSATLFATQIDFTYAGDLKVFVDEEQIADIEKQMSVRGYLEGRQMSAAFNMLRSNDLIWPYVIGAYFKGKEPLPFDLLYWNSDATRMPAANHSFYLRNCYLDNRLSRGTMEIGGVRLDLRQVKIPVYNLATREDHIAPPRSVFFGSSFLGGPVTFVLTGSGHIAGIINPPSRKKYQYWTGDPPGGDRYQEWLATAEEHPGSWWPHWQAWIEALDDTRVKARRVGGGKLKAIEEAPGRYVRVQA